MLTADESDQGPEDGFSVADLTTGDTVADGAAAIAALRQREGGSAPTAALLDRTRVMPQAFLSAQSADLPSRTDAPPPPSINSRATALHTTTDPRPPLVDPVARPTNDKTVVHLGFSDDALPDAETQQAPSMLQEPMPPAGPLGDVVAAADRLGRDLPTRPMTALFDATIESGELPGAGVDGSGTETPREPTPARRDGGRSGSGSGVVANAPNANTHANTHSNTTTTPARAPARWPIGVALFFAVVTVVVVAVIIVGLLH